MISSRNSMQCYRLNQWFSLQSNLLFIFYILFIIIYYYSVPVFIAFWVCVWGVLLLLCEALCVSSWITFDAEGKSLSTTHVQSSLARDFPPPAKNLISQSVGVVYD